MCVVGAGTAGAVAAMSAKAHGVSVALIDTKPRNQIGNKVCGDTVSCSIIQRLGELVGFRGLMNSVERTLTGVEIFLKDTDYSMSTEVEFYSVDRLTLGQELVASCEGMGVKISDGCAFLRPIFADGVVSGIQAHSHVNGIIEIDAPIVIDATGLAGRVRKFFPPISESLDPYDMWNCYREIRKLEKETELVSSMSYYVDQRLAPGGISWSFPRSSTNVNAGVCTPSITGFNPKQLFDKFVVETSYFTNSKVLESAAAPEPVRRPLNTLVSDGVMVVGDAAFQTSPITGGGIDYSIYAGEIAGRVAAQSMSKKGVEARDLWPYNLEFMRTVGREIAIQDVFRRFLWSLTNNEVKFIVDNGLLDEHDFIHLYVGGQYSGGIVNIVKKCFRLLPCVTSLPLFFNTLQALRRVRKVARLYENFPEPHDLPEWKLKVSGLFKEMPSRIARE